MSMGLDKALQVVAERSFDEDVTVTPNGNGTYGVSDDFGTAYAGDPLGWTYAGGLEVPKGVRDWSRLFEPFEYWDNAGHVRYNLPEAVEALERGMAVTFAYVVVINSDLLWWEEQQTYVDDDGYRYDDNITGWCVLAFWED